MNVELLERLAEAETGRNALSCYITARLSLRSAVIVFDTLTESRSGVEARAQPREIVLSGAFKAGRNYQPLQCLVFGGLG